MKIGIVNDLVLAREALRRVVASSSEDQVAWLACDGEEAVERARVDPPDLILMDLIMPRLEGVEAARRILASQPCSILIVTSSVSGNISKVYEAMGLGAVDAVETPVLGPSGVEGSQELLQKIRRIDRLRSRAPAPRFRSGGTSPASPFPATPRRAGAGLLAIGSSTGGPKVLAELLPQLPVDLGVPVVVIQHVDPAFAPGMALWLAKLCALPVEMAPAGVEPQSGRVYLAKTEEHLVLGPTGRFEYTPEPRSCHYRPSVNAFFFSLARHSRAPGTAVVLTGMGRDGAEGLLELRRRGWVTVAQDQASSTVYGMPRAAVELGAAQHVLDPPRLARFLGETLPRRGR